MPAALGKAISSSRLRIAMTSSIITVERQCDGKRRNRLYLSNGMRLAPLTNVTNDSPTMLSDGLVPQQHNLPGTCTNGYSVILTLPFTF